MIYLDTPTVLQIPKTDVSDIQLQQLKTALTYTDKKVVFELARLKRNARWFSEEDFNEKQADLEAKTKKCLLFETPSQYWTYSGNTSIVSRILRQTPENRIIYPEPQLLPWEQEPPYAMRPYQEEICRKLLECRHGGVSVGTGLGKTLSLTHLVKRLGLKTVVMAPSDSIADQIYRDFLKYFGKKYVGKFCGSKKEPKKLIIVGTGQSLTRVQEGTDVWNELLKVQVFIADESHQTPAATFQKVCLGPIARAPYRFFFSATQMRNDGTGLLLDAITGPIVYNMAVRDGVNQGYLAKPIFHMYHAPANGTFDRDDPNDMTRHHLYYNPKVVAHIGKLCNQAATAKLPVLVLIDEVEQFTKLLPYLRFQRGFAHGPLADNKVKVPKEYWESDPNELVKEFNAHKFPILVGTSCISTGTDVQAVRFLIYWKGGKSEIEVKQGIGRGTRMVPGKTTCHVVDYWVHSPSGADGTGRGDDWVIGKHTSVRSEIYDDLYGPVINEGTI